MSESLNIAFLEPYYGGSHAAFVDTWSAFSRHHITLDTLPARKWKWRMRGAAIWFSRRAAAWGRSDDGGAVEAIVCSDMLSVADLRAMLPGEMRNVPIVCYFHENQLTYPMSADDKRDYQYGMTNITSCLAADAVWFNSCFHRDDFLAAARELLRKMPDFVPTDIIDRIKAKSAVLPPPIALRVAPRQKAAAGEPLTILWCHRWEFDKNPEVFFAALLRLSDEGVPFRLLLLGEQFRTAPAVFSDSWDRLEPHIVHAGHVDGRQEYIDMLATCDLVVSTAIQENFGIAVLEAILSGCQPLLPRRLAYPEIIPEEFHAACLFPADGDLCDRLRHLLGGGLMDATDRRRLQASCEARFGAVNVIPRIDNALSAIVRLHRATR